MDRSGAADTVLCVLSTCTSTPRLPQTNAVLEQISLCRDIFRSEPSLLDIHGAFVIVGDIHGNLTDLVRIFERTGYPPSTNYLFLGDVVDRGPNSVEAILLLFALKILFKDHIYFVRGNHECDSICSTFGFQTECEVKLGTTVYSQFIDCFSFLPFAARLNSSVLCVHGGISADVKSLKNIEALPRPMPSFYSPVSFGLVWSDPRPEGTGFDPSDRGSGEYFNPVVLADFLKENGLSLLVRGHEMCENGYDWPLGPDGKCLTVFSTSDYCGIGNLAAVAKIAIDGDVKFEVFEIQTARRKMVLIPECILQETFDPTGGLLGVETGLDAEQDLLDPRICDSVDLFSEF
jgi:protein phosphatase